MNINHNINIYYEPRLAYKMRTKMSESLWLRAGYGSFSDLNKSGDNVKVLLKDTSSGKREEYLEICLGRAAKLIRETF